MEFLLRGGVQFDLLYNCSFYKVTDIPLERRVDVPFGVSEISICSLESVLYLPCLWSIWRMRESSCFKLMFVMGLLDLVSLGIVGIIDGWFHILGYVYCSAPTLIYTLGSVHVGAYVARTSVEMILAADRCMFFVRPDWAYSLFPEKTAKVWLWVVPPLLYGFGAFLFGHAFVFSALTACWMISPHNSYHDEMEHLYLDGGIVWWGWHNKFFMALLPLIYTAFFLTILKRSREITNVPQEQRTTSTKRIFVQVALIVSLNCIYSYISVISCYYWESFPSYIQHILGPFQKWFFLQVAGLPPIVYLTLNKNIRGDCKRLALEVLEKVGVMCGGEAANNNNTTSGLRSRTLQQQQQQQNIVGNNVHGGRGVAAFSSRVHPTVPMVPVAHNGGGENVATATQEPLPKERANEVDEIE